MDVGENVTGLSYTATLGGVLSQWVEAVVRDKM
jgi:hypothetical protein